MPCITETEQNPARRAEIKSTLERLKQALGAGAVTVTIGATGGIAFTGWNDRNGVSDLCAFRKLAASNSPELRRAVMRAEVKSGRKIDPRAIAAGVHSHDGGQTWGQH
jgi:5,10-methylenetetrahydrofolate reductase